MVRRSALEQVAGFDEDLRVGEDVDLVWRLGGAGWSVRYEPAAAVSHPNRSSVPAWARQRVDYGSSAALLQRRHPGAAAPAAVSRWSALAWGLAAAGRPLSAGAVATVTTALLVPRLRALAHPAGAAVRLAGKGHLFAGVQLADAVRRAWWPLVVPVAIARPRVRWALAAAFVIPPAARWWKRRPAIGPVRFVAAKVVDDAAYSLGVWLGCARDRSAAALRPDLSSWPGRQAAVSTPTTDTNETISPG